MHAAFGSVHASLLGTIAVVEQFGGQASEHRAGFGLKLKGGDCGAVLPEIHHQGLARAHHHGGALAEALLHNHPSILVLALACDSLPRICLHRSKGEVLTQVYLGTGRRQYLALELVAHLGNGKLVGGVEALWHTCVILLAVEDGRMGHGTGYA